MKRIFKITSFFISVGLSVSAMAAQETNTLPVKTLDAAQVKAAIANPAVTITQQNGNSILVSARTGLRYVVSNPTNRPIVFDTGALQPVNAENVKRIVATNPALSTKSQEQAEKALLDLAGVKEVGAPQQDAL